MQVAIRNKISPFIFSVFIHAGALLIIILTFDLQGTQVIQLDNPDQEIIQGMLINETIMNQEIQRVLDEREDTRMAEERVRTDIQNRDRERQAEVLRQEQQRQDEARIADENERNRLQQIQREEAQRIEQEQRQRRAELDRQKMAEEARMRAAMQERERLVEEARANTEARALQQRQALEDQQERNAWVRLIQARIRQAWISPGATDYVLCRLLVTLIPSGEVVGVTVQECNASDQIILSVERAVRRASPLPLPRITSVFERRLELDFIIEKQ
jgi:colicin import membrane protein